MKVIKIFNSVTSGGMCTCSNSSSTGQDCGSWRRHIESTNSFAATEKHKLSVNFLSIYMCILHVLVLNCVMRSDAFGLKI
ncbi:hypothetical protein Hanom_Chr11g00975031 [Helianthus anomalus]